MADWQPVRWPVKFEGDNPALIYLPEADFELEQFAKDLRALWKNKTA